MSTLLIGGLGSTELLIVLAVLVLLFGASKLPELARGSGRALRIFKAETKGLMDDDEPSPSSHSHESNALAESRASELEAEAARLRRGEPA